LTVILGASPRYNVNLKGNFMESRLLSPVHPICFNEIEASDIVPVIARLVDTAKSAVDTLVHESSPATWNNTLGALEALTEPVEITSSIVEHLESIATTPELRVAYNAMLPITTAFYTGLLLNGPLYERLTAYSGTTEAKALDPIRKRLLNKTLEEFKRHGAALASAEKVRLAELDEQLSQLTAKFSQHVLDATQAFELVITGAEQLAGLPESALAMAKASAEEKGMQGFRLTLQAPCLVAVLTYADDAALRERVWRANDSRCRAGAFATRDLVQQILQLRHEKARLLGFETFADLVMADRMAKNGATAQEFVDELRQATLLAFERERQALVDFRNTLEGTDSSEIPIWDMAYYAEKMRKALLDFDEEELRGYFPVESMLEAVFTVSSELFGISIEVLDAIPTWDPAVRVYAINDASGEQMGIFYLDLFPRENKQSGAWMHGLISGKPNIAVVAANANPPTPDTPSLLSHRDVETLWHEFGHLLHHCLSRVPVRSLSGTRVAHDFVELPSQIMENWCWEAQVLNRFARHWRTQELIPRRLLDRLHAVRRFRAATAQMRQLGFAALDLAMHRSYDSNLHGDFLEYARAVQQAYSPAPLPQDYAMVTTFTHLFSRPVGYAAGYYAYKWAEVLEADAYQRFVEEGIDNCDVGRSWRMTILGAGDSRKPMDLFVEFRGHKPDKHALLARLGLLG
jgi:oligopeptidase A